MIFKTNYNIGQKIYDPITGEMSIPGQLDNPGYDSYHMPSETIPGQAMSIQEMLNRLAAGLPIDGVKVPLYEADENQPDDDLIMGHPDLSKMDLVDRQEYLDQQQARLNTLKQKFAQQKSEAKAKADQEQKAQRTQAPEDEYIRDDAQPAEGAPNILKKPGAQGQRPATKQKEGGKNE